MNAPDAIVAFERELFRRSFDRRPFLIAHGLTDHPLFALERLLELARALPATQVEYNAGDLPVAHDPRQTPRTGLSATETIRRIEQCRSWLVLKNVESDPQYRALAQQCLRPMRVLCPDMRALEAFVFVSSPHAVTPLHIDPECNFLLQIRGSKTIHTFAPEDRTVVSERELERFYAGGSRNLLRLCPDGERGAEVFELTAGRGLHIPVHAPHWVRNGSAVSISFSVTFRTDASDRREIAYRLNHHLRRLHLRPRPVGQSRLVDATKYALFDTGRRIVRALRGVTRRSA